MLKKAKLARQVVTIRTDDGQSQTGTIEKLGRWTVTLRLEDGVVFIPIRDIETVSLP